MSSRLEVFGIAAAAIAAGTLYVLVHEARRKSKKAAKAAAEAPISKEMLLKILNTKTSTFSRVAGGWNIHLTLIENLTSHLKTLKWSAVPLACHYLLVISIEAGQRPR